MQGKKSETQTKVKQGKNTLSMQT